MTQEPFDPYTACLNLPGGERPSHYYELLGLELFCSHHERIHQAVRKQFRIIKQYHDHPDRNTRETIQDIMNTIAIARVVLTDPDQKEQYDLALATRLDIDRDVHLAANVAAPLPEFEVMVVAGPTRVRSRFDLIEGTRFTIGSDTRNLLAIDAGRAAERHCVIGHSQGEWIIKPVHPSLPLRVNDHDTDEFVLAHGDRIDIAGYRLVFVARDRRVEIETAHADGPPPLSLIILKGPSIPTPVFNILPLQHVVVGHGESALWQLPDPTVSSQHCAISSAGDYWEVEDLESTNGTRVNDTAITRHPLRDRDVIAIGGFDILASLRF